MPETKGNARKGIRREGAGPRALLRVNICVALSVRVNTVPHTYFTCSQNQVTKSSRHACGAQNQIQSLMDCTY